MDMFELDEVNELVEKLTKWSEAYYAGNPIVSDPVYDAAEIRLRELDSKNSYFNRVGSNKVKESTFEKVQHKELMLSLNKAYSLKELTSWVKPNFGYGIAMPKMDGFAISLTYKFIDYEYVLIRAVTRGESDKGEDVTENIKQISDIPHIIHCTKVDENFIDEFEVRGEVYMRHSVFETLDIKAENCRNIAPGSVRQKNPLVTKSRRLNYFAYNLLFTKHDTMSDRLECLKNLGFQVVNYIKVDLNNEESVQNAYNSYVEWRTIIDFDIDGVVFMIDDITIIEELGNTSHHPRGAIAWKFEAEEGETTFLEYQWQVSRTGLVNPVGIYEGIRLDGATLTNATLHNLSIVKKMNIGVGDKIIVSRRGGVIPQIERVERRISDRGADIPIHCPVCGSELVTCISDKGIETLRCVSIDCSAQVLTRILHFVSVMEIMDVGESIIEKMINANFINDSADLFNITKDNLLTLEGIKDKSAERTLKNIELARKKSLGKFLAALGIKGLGSSVSETVASHFETLDRVLNAQANDFEAIPGIASITAGNIYDGLKANCKLIETLRKNIEVIGIEPKVIGGVLSGKSFLITGTLSQPRSYFENLVEKNGGALKSSVSKTLDYLLVGDNPGGKLDKAKKSGVKIILEEEFMSMINN
ncbi:MAG: NAD-dependent DNA ligase LigA [Methanothrix sp.]|nr:NAD-dependent DNA ligase LigA [Methanothrix sp.]